MGWGSVLHAASAQHVLVGTKSDVQNGGKSILENSYPGPCCSQEEQLLNSSLFLKSQFYFFLIIQ